MCTQVSSSDSAAAGSSVVYPIISKSKALLAPEEALTFKGQTLNLIVTFAQDNGSGSRIAVTLPGFLPNHVEVKISAPGVSSSLMPMKSIRRLSSDAYSLVIAPYEDTWPKVCSVPPLFYIILHNNFPTSVEALLQPCYRMRR